MTYKDYYKEQNSDDKMKRPDKFTEYLFIIVTLLFFGGAFLVSILLATWGIRLFNKNVNSVNPVFNNNEVNK